MMVGIIFHRWLGCPKFRCKMRLAARSPANLQTSMFRFRSVFTTLTTKYSTAWDCDYLMPVFLNSLWGIGTWRPQALLVIYCRKSARFCKSSFCARRRASRSKGWTVRAACEDWDAIALALALIAWIRTGMFLPIWSFQCICSKPLWVERKTTCSSPKYSTSSTFQVCGDS